MSFCDWKKEDLISTPIYHYNLPFFHADYWNRLVCNNRFPPKRVLASAENHVNENIGASSNFNLYIWRFVLIRRQATNICWRLTNKPITSHIHNVNEQTGYKYYFIDTFRRRAFLRWPRSKVRTRRDFDLFFSLSVLLRTEEEETAFCTTWILLNTDASTLNLTTCLL